jgi:hypothetical protein
MSGVFEFQVALIKGRSLEAYKKAWVFAGDNDEAIRKQRNGLIRSTLSLKMPGFRLPRVAATFVACDPKSFDRRGAGIKGCLIQREA